MKSVFVTLAAVTLGASSALAQLTVNTPFNPVVCQPVLINWSGGTPPYFLLLPSIFDGNSPNSPALFDFGEVKGNSLTWKVNFAAGRSIGLTIRDQTGTTAQSAPFSINAGTDTSCVGQTAVTSAVSTTSGGSAPTATTPTTGAPATTTPTTGAPTLTTPVVGGTSTTKPGSITSGSNTATKSSSANAAPTQAAGFGAAAVIGAAAIALLA